MTRPKLNENPDPKMTDAEVTKLAHDIVTNQVFMSDQIRRPMEVTMVFFVLALADTKIIDDYLRAGIIHFYEYYNKAMPRSVNGYPMFSSCYGINSIDYKRVRAEELRMRKALGEPCPEPQETSKSSVTTTPPKPTPSGPTKPPPSSKESGSRKPSGQTRK